MSSEKHFVQLCHTRAARNRRSHINEAKCTSRKGFSTARATCDFRFCWWATHTILTKASALMRHWGTAVGDWFATKITTHKHLQSKWKEQFSANHNGFIKSDTEQMTWNFILHCKMIHLISSQFMSPCSSYIIWYFLSPLLIHFC